MMRSLLLAATALTAFSAVASAADLPARSAAPAPVIYAPIFTWTGFYVGLNAGYGWQNSSDVTFYNTVTNTFVTVSNTSNSDGGFVGGGQLGYNWQMGQIVFGAEADIQYADLGHNNNYYPYWYGSGSSNNYFGTVRARLGFAVDRALLYVTGGLAYGDVGGNFFGSSNTKAGWTVGAGVEYAFTNNWTARVEGLWVNIDSGNKVGYFTYLGNPWTATSNKNDGFGVVRAAINYKF
jgi:outer membrane immunogenic protein